jgi:hypothetical protein
MNEACCTLSPITTIDAMHFLVNAGKLEAGL